MKFLIIYLSLIILVLHSTFANAETIYTYDIKIDLSLHGKQVSSPRIILKENQEGNLRQKDKSGKEYFIDITALHKETKTVKNGVLLKLSIGTLENGNKQIIAKPHLFTKENQSAEISQSDEKGKENISLKIIAIKK